MAIYQKFLDGVPWYLARHYWWAYLWTGSIWFFDHQPIINAILFGQYRRLMDETLLRYRPEPGSRTLQLTCVYGLLTPKLSATCEGKLHVMDASMDQLRLAQQKCRESLAIARMHAEHLGYADHSFDQVILFFLLHEMPPESRATTLAEMVRVTRPGGTILITEYSERPEHHLLYKIPLFRWLLGRLEPFLPGFWDEHLDATLQRAADESDKQIEKIDEVAIFTSFYRVAEYRVKSNIV